MAQVTLTNQERTLVLKSGGVYASFKVEKACAERLHKFLKENGVPNPVPPEKMHVTTVFSRKEFEGYEPSKAKVIVNPKTFKMGKLGEENVVVMFFKSDHVSKQHKKATDLGATWDYEGFNPHVTLSYDAPDNFKMVAKPDFPLVLDNESVEKLELEWAEDRGLRKGQPTMSDVHIPSTGGGKKKKIKKGHELLEDLSSLEHEQWVHWSKSLAEKVTLPEVILERWQRLWGDYGLLPEEEKEMDRTWARDVLSIIASYTVQEESGTTGHSIEPTSAPSDEELYNEINGVCFYCECKTSKLLIWAGGSRILPVCSDHALSGVNKIVTENKDSVNLVVDLNRTKITIEKFEKDKLEKKEDDMPYPTNASLPDSVKDVLPIEAQTIFRTVVNSQLDGGLSEERAFASAWGALKNQGWEKQDEGRWVKVEKNEKPEGITLRLRVGKSDEEESLTEFEYSTTILKARDEKQLITGVVLEPDTEDAHGDIVSSDEIEQAAHEFMIKSRVVGLQHKKKASGVEVVESYISTADMIIGKGKVKKGSWIMTVKVKGKSLWKKVKVGDFTGFSIGGVAIRKK